MQPIKLFGPGADSGTFDYFTEAIVGKSKSSRGDFTASEDDNVLVQGVSRDVNALGYFGYAYYIENKDKLKAVPIVNEKGQAGRSRRWTRCSRAPTQPLSRPIFIYVNAKSLAQARGQGVRRVLHEARGQARARSEVRAAARLRPTRVGMEHVQKGKKGTVFGGNAEVGVTIEELLKREAKL